MNINTINALQKIAYGGDLTGSGNSEYDLADFYSVDPEWDEPDVLDDRERYKETVDSMKEFARNLLKSPSPYAIGRKPITQVVLSTTRYNESDNINGTDWAKQTLAAIKSKDKEQIGRLARYGYGWYGTADAKDSPLGYVDHKNTSVKRSRSKQTNKQKDKEAQVPGTVKLGLYGLGGLAGVLLGGGAYALYKALLDRQ